MNRYGKVESASSDMTGNRQNTVPHRDLNKALTPYRTFTLSVAAVTFLMVVETS
jgi:hypothetical protein